MNYFFSGGVIWLKTTKAKDELINDVKKGKTALKLGNIIIDINLAIAYIYNGEELQEIGGLQ